MGMCPTHYSQGLLGYKPLSRNDAPYANCAVPHCDLEANSRKEGALCNPHYQRKYRGLDVEAYVIPPEHPARNAPPCAEPGCERRSVTKGFCNYHRLRAQQGKSSVPSTVKVNPPCAFGGCEYLSSQTGLCQGHYEQKRMGQELKPLREWGKYVTGELRCPIPTCRRPQMTQGVCSHHSRMSREYKLTTEQMIEVWKNPVCSNGACGNTTKLHMDHNHTTGEFRALLCNGCNSALGFLKENPERISGLREYIERFS